MWCIWIYCYHTSPQDWTFCSYRLGVRFQIVIVEKEFGREHCIRQRDWQSIKYFMHKTALTSKPNKIQLLALDWQSNAILELPMLVDADNRLEGGIQNIDLLIACHCIYNESSTYFAFTETCVEISKLKAGSNTPTICVLAQQLRSNIVLHAWLSSFSKVFRV